MPRFIFAEWGEDMDREFYRNSEGYVDPTAHQAVVNMDTDKRANELVHVLKYIIRHSGFELVERLQIRDKKTGRVYK